MKAKAKKSKSSDDLKNYLCDNFNAENLDNIRPRPPEGFQMADLMFEGRSVILELKEFINVSPGKNIKVYEGLHETFSKYGINVRTGLPRFEAWPEEDLLKFQRFFLDDTTFVQKKYSQADKQIKDTKDFLGLSNARGVFMILNKSPNVAPIDLYYRTMHLICKRERYPNIDTVLCYNADTIMHSSTTTFFELVRDPTEPSFVRRLLDCLEKNRGKTRSGIVDGRLPIDVPWGGRRPRLTPDFS